MHVVKALSVKYTLRKVKEYILISLLHSENKIITKLNAHFMTDRLSNNMNVLIQDSSIFS